MEESLSTLLEQQDAWTILQEIAAGGSMCALPELPPGKRNPQQRLNSNDSLSQVRSWQPDLRYRSLIEKLPVVTFMAALDDSVQELYISPQIYTLLGYTQEEWLEDPLLWYRQLHPDDKEAWVAEFARTCSTGAPFRVEYRMIARDGRIVWVQGQCQVIRDEQGQPLFLQGIALDITHWKQAEKVEKARVEAEAANKAKSEFLARMSHEIRTPLNGVVGMIDLLRGTHMNEGQQRYAHLAREAADSLLNVINDILDFSKIEAGKVEVEAIEFELHKLLEDLTELLAPVAAKKKLSLTCLVRPEVPLRAIGDPNRIRQVLTNLVNNAMKFTPAGYVNVRASLDAADGENSTIRIEVEDTGIGIPPDRLDRLFKSFSQVDTSHSRKFGGTGLGLVISKQLVELMGGQINIKSEVGHGTTFWFTLKLQKSRVTEPAEDSFGLAEALRATRVLLVESEAAQRKILAEQIEGRLSRTSSVVGLDQAIITLRAAAAERNAFSVVMLPWGSAEGMALASAIRADSAIRDARLIAVLEIDDRTDESAIARHGFVGRLHRPLLQSRLMDAIATATIQKSAKNMNRRQAPESAADSLSSLKGLHFLVAEDNEMNQFVTQETLKRVESTCEIVGDGALAVEAVQKQTFDAVLMDCQMPGMDGLTATRRIREMEAATPNGRHIPIIALTAEAIQGDRERCLAAGMDGYVSKPINPKELFAAIRSLVPAKVQTAAALSSPPSDSADRAASKATEESPLDLQALLTRCMQDTSFAARTLEKFARRATEDVEVLRKGITAGDIEGTARTARNLNAVAGHVSATALGKIASEIERASAQRDSQYILERLERLADEARRCAAFIPTAIAELSKKPQAYAAPK